MINIQITATTWPQTTRTSLTVIITTRVLRLKLTATEPSTTQNKNTESKWSHPQIAFGSKVAFSTWSTTLGLLQVFFLWPPTPQFEHFAAFLSFWGRSPLCGHVVLLCPGSQHILEKRVRLLVPHPFPACAFAVGLYFLLFAPRSSYRGLSLRVVGRPGFRFRSGAFSPMKLPIARATCTNGESCVASLSLLLLPSPCIDLWARFVDVCRPSCG